MSRRIEFTYTANPMPYTFNGITWDSPQSHQFSANGTVSGGNSYIRLYNRYAKPSWLTYGIDYELILQKNGSTNKVQFVIQTRVGQTWSNLVVATGNTTFNIPQDNYAEFNIMLRVMNNTGSVDETVYPYVYEAIPFTPRFDEYTPTRIRGNPYYYDNSINPYAYPGNYMPNCTTYAWGRWTEIMGGNPPTSDLGRGNGEDWFPNTNPNGIYTKVPANSPNCVPRLGAIACWAVGPYSRLGHVAIVEKIYDNGDVLFSNSGYGYEFFYLRCANGSDNYHAGKRDYRGYEQAYIFQGFIYLPDEYSPSPQPTPTKKKPLWFYCRRKPF